VILIFLMITTTYSKFTSLQITLPVADAEKAMQRPSEIYVMVDAQGRYEINGTRVSFSDIAGLADDLKNAAGNGESKKNPVVIVNADAMATHQSVINVLEAARLAGLVQLTFAAQTGAKK
jgi:biopolymer transport protein ExbD